MSGISQKISGRQYGKTGKLGGMRIVLGVGPKRTSLARVPDVVRRYNGAGEIDTR